MQIHSAMNQIQSNRERGVCLAQQHSLSESRRVAVDAAGAQVVDEGQVFGDVRRRPATEEAVQQALVPS